MVLESFSPMIYCETITGGTLQIINPTQKAFENLTLNLRIDDSHPITPYLRLVMPLAADAPFAHYSTPITTVSIEPTKT